MQMFTVPQFIDVEDKVIGAMTVRQFIICLAGLVFIAIGWKLFDLGLFIVWSIVCLVIFGSFAFVKINGRPFHYFVLNFIQTLKKPRLRVWNHRNPLKDAAEGEGPKGMRAVPKAAAKTRPQLSRLKELSLVVDTKGAYRGGEDEEIV